MRLSLSPTELRVGDSILTLSPKGRVTSQQLVRKLAWCPSHTKGVKRIHVNENQCYDGVVTLDIERKS